MTIDFMMALAGILVFFAVGYVLLRLLKGKGYLAHAVSFLALLAVVLLCCDIVAPLLGATHTGLVIENARPTLLGTLITLAVLASGVLLVWIKSKQTPVKDEKDRMERAQNYMR